jgi:hypothetical protein
MSTLKTGKVKTTTIANELDTESTDVTNVINGSAKAWVNFNGTGTVAIRESFNVSSITDNGTAIYAVNFTNAMPDANYIVCGMCNWNINGWGTVQLYSSNSGNPFSTTAVDIRTLEYSNQFDAAFITVAVFR